MDTRLLDVQHLLRSNGILISFSGRLSQGLIEEYGEAVKKYLEVEDRPQNQIYNTFSVFIEQTQNIKNYCTLKAESDHYETIAQSSIVTIGKTDNGSYVCSGNLIENNDGGPLAAYLDYIIQQDKTGLKTMYKEKLKQAVSPDSTGAGLGLIDMARKAASPLEYSIVDLNGGLSFFTLKAIV